MKFTMSLIIEDINGKELEAFTFDSCNALESKIQEVALKYPFIVGEEHLTVVTLKVGSFTDPTPLPEEAFTGTDIDINSDNYHLVLPPSIDLLEEDVPEEYKESIEEEAEPAAAVSEEQDPENDSEIPW